MSYGLELVIWLLRWKKECRHSGQTSFGVRMSLGHGSQAVVGESVMLKPVVVLKEEEVVVSTVIYCPKLLVAWDWKEVEAVVSQMAWMPEMVNEEH